MFFLICSDIRLFSLFNENISFPREKKRERDREELWKKLHELEINRTKNFPMITNNDSSTAATSTTTTASSGGQQQVNSNKTNNITNTLASPSSAAGSGTQQQQQSPNSNLFNSFLSSTPLPTSSNPSLPSSTSLTTQSGGGTDLTNVAGNVAISATK